MMDISIDIAIRKAARPGGGWDRRLYVNGNDAGFVMIPCLSRQARIYVTAGHGLKVGQWRGKSVPAILGRMAGELAHSQC